MFIVCPSCSGPFRIPADQIAPLVQTACPHCEYRIILDFEAANDPSLREAGQQYAQGFESVEAYASVYDHVTSKPDVQPRLGVTSVTVKSDARPSASQSDARLSAASSGSGSAASSGTRPLQRSSTEPTAPAPVSTPAVAPAATGNRHKTVLQVPSKKPVSMDPRGESPAPVAAAPSGTSMRAGKGVELVEEPRLEEPKVEARSQPSEASEPNERKPPHTPPTTGVVSSGPPASETPPVEDIAAQSGKLPVAAQPGDLKPTGTAAAKPTGTAAVKPAEAGGSGAIYYIIVLLIVGGLIAMVLLNR